MVGDRRVSSRVKADDYRGPAFPLDAIEMIKAPAPGTVLFHRTIGDRVEAGDLLAVIVTRSSARFVRRRDDMMKIACAAPTGAGRGAGTLED